MWRLESYSVQDCTTRCAAVDCDTLLTKVLAPSIPEDGGVLEHHSQLKMADGVVVVPDLVY
jgi:hypothetical protein